VVLAVRDAQDEGPTLGEPNRNGDSNEPSGYVATFYIDYRGIDGISPVANVWTEGCEFVTVAAGQFRFETMEAVIRNEVGEILGTARPVLHEFEGTACRAKYSVPVTEASVYELEIPRLRTFRETRSFESLVAADWQWAAAG
jgi:hypothetical protein